MELKERENTLKRGHDCKRSSTREGHDRSWSNSSQQSIKLLFKLMERKCGKRDSFEIPFSCVSRKSSFALTSQQRMDPSPTHGAVNEFSALLLYDPEGEPDNLSIYIGIK